MLTHQHSRRAIRAKGCAANVPSPYHLPRMIAGEGIEKSERKKRAATRVLVKRYPLPLMVAGEGIEKKSRGVNNEKPT